MRFLPFQQSWINDTSRLKILEKSRRCGGTFSTAYRTFRDLAKYKGHDIVVVSRDENLATEYIRNVTSFFKLWNAVRPRDAIPERGFKRLSIDIPHRSGTSRLIAVSSNPDSAAGKGGSLVIDEMALHRDPEMLLRVAQPIIMAGGNLSILSTHRSRNSKFNELVEKAKLPGSDWSLHTTTIVDAVNEGLVELIVNPTMIRLGNEPWESREAFLEWLRNTYDAHTFAQEFMCMPSEDSTSLLTMDEVDNAKAKYEAEGSIDKGGLYLGYDCAESIYGDFAAISVIRAGMHDVELVEPYYFPRGTSITEQLDLVESMARKYKVIKVVSDNAGIGRHPTTLLKDRLGDMRVVAFDPTMKSKEGGCVKVKRYFQNNWFRMQADKQVEADFLSIDRLITTSGNIVYHASRKDQGHGDMFSATMMALTEVPEMQMADIKGVRANDVEIFDKIMNSGELSIHDRILRNRKLDEKAKKRFTY